MSHAQSTLSLLRDLRYEKSTGLLLAWPTPELDLLHNLTVLEGPSSHTSASWSARRALLTLQFQNRTIDSTR